MNSQQYSDTDNRTLKGNTAQKHQQGRIFANYVIIRLIRHTQYCLLWPYEEFKFLHSGGWWSKTVRAAANDRLRHNPLMGYQRFQSQMAQGSSELTDSALIKFKFNSNSAAACRNYYETFWYNSVHRPGLRSDQEYVQIKHVAKLTLWAKETRRWTSTVWNEATIADEHNPGGVDVQR